LDLIPTHCKLPSEVFESLHSLGMIYTCARACALKHYNTHTKAITEVFRKKLPFLACVLFTAQWQLRWESLHFWLPPSLCVSLCLCVLPLNRTAQTAWERLTTRGSAQRHIKGPPICTAAYTHPHIHKHWLTYLGLLSLNFIASGRTITLFDSVCVWVNYWGGARLTNRPKRWNSSRITITFLLFPY